MPPDMDCHPSPVPSTARRLKIAVRGVVQGVGFRPFVYGLARAGGLSGWVSNDADTVRIEVQGEADRLEAFVDALRNHPPPQARIGSIEVGETACERDGSASLRDSPQRRGSSPPG